MSDYMAQQMDRQIEGAQHAFAAMSDRVAELEAQAKASEWQPIETAPKDGTRIIIGSADGAWMAEYKPVYQSGYRPDNPWFSVMLNLEHMGMFPKAKPTHWMPLPAPPKSTCESKEKAE